MNLESMSFEAKIGLALQGSNWQQLQNTPAETEEKEEVVPEDELDEVIAEDDIDLDVAEDNTEKPKVLTDKQKKKMERFAAIIGRDAGDVLETIHPEAIIPVVENITWEQEPDLLCCYNWDASTDRTNTIFVPGEPGKFHQPTLPHTLKPDSGLHYNDYNYARQPRTPFSAMFHALGAMRPNYQFNDVDVLADRNNLRVLLEVAQGKFNGPFRLDLYTVYNTLVIVRKETSWWKKSNGESYGFNFEKFFTRPAEGMEDATSHYRAIRYPMGPLNVVCRFEADAFDDKIISDELTSSEAAAVSGGLKAVPKFDYSARIRVQQRGHIVPTAQIVELKTQTHNPENPKLVACQDQLWFGRTSLLFTGPYTKGTGVVKRVKQEDATERVKVWERSQQEPLRKLVALLSQLRDVVKRERSSNHGAVLVRETRDGPLVVRSMKGYSHGVEREFFQKHWQQPVRQPGAHRGQRGSDRGSFNPHRGRGHSMPPWQQSSAAPPYGGVNYVPPQGRGGFAPPYDRGNVVLPQGRGHYVPPQGRGNYTPPQVHSNFAPHNQGRGNFTPYQGRGQGQYDTSGSRGPSHAPRGRGYGERRRSPDYSHGAPRS